MPTFRDEMNAVADAARSSVIEGLGLRLHVVQTCRRTWSGTAIGKGVKSDTVTTISPAPKVRPVLQTSTIEAGKRETGDVEVSKISVLQYTEADLAPTDLQPTEEWCWLIDGSEYAPVEKPVEEFLGWSVKLRRRSRK